MPPPTDEERAAAAAAAAAQQSSRTVAIPKFDGVPPAYQSSKNWLAGTALYWGTKLDTITQAELEGFLAFALKDTALRWYQVTNEGNTPITTTWAVFKKEFEDHWGKPKLPRATLAARIKQLSLLHDEPLKQYRIRCLEVARDATVKLKAPDGETDAMKQQRLIYQDTNVNDNAMWFFINGLPDVIKNPLLEKDFDSFKECMEKVERVSLNLVNLGKYKDPSLGLAKPQANNLQVLNPYVSSISGQDAHAAASLPPAVLSPEQLHYYGVAPIAAAIKPRSKPPPKPNQGRGPPKKQQSTRTGKVSSRMLSNPADYTPDAKCNYCGVPNHTEAQCWSKKKANNVSSIRVTQAYGPDVRILPEAGAFHMDSLNIWDDQDGDMMLGGELIDSSGFDEDSWDKADEDDYWLEHRGQPGEVWRQPAPSRSQDFH